MLGVSFFYFAMQPKILFMFLLITTISFSLALPHALPAQSHNIATTMNFLSHNFDCSTHFCAFLHLWFHMQRMMKIVVAHKTEVNKTVTLGISVRGQIRKKKIEDAFGLQIENYKSVLVSYLST